MFEIMFEDEDQVRKHVWQTSWGVSTRLVGGVIMTHGDENGLILPPRIAPYQVVIVPIIAGDTREAVLAKARDIAAQVKPVARVYLDDRETYTPGWKYNQWEMKGVPLRLEIGPKDIQKDQCVLVRRDTREKTFCPMPELSTCVASLLVQVQSDLLERARTFRDDNTRRVSTYDEFKDVIENQRGFVLAPWCGNGDCELQVKADTKATIRVIPLAEDNTVIGASGGACVRCGAAASHEAYFARAY
jgi:prolyl-tRNA synthetase